MAIELFTMPDGVLLWITCVAADTKPTTGIPVGSILVETDTGLVFRWGFVLGIPTWVAM